MQLQYHMVTIDDFVPQDYFLRKLEAALDLSFAYEETQGMYSQRIDRPPIDPVILVKYVLVGFLYGIPSERQIEQRIQTDVALRWYLGLDLFDPAPDHSIWINWSVSTNISFRSNRPQQTRRMTFPWHTGYWKITELTFLLYRKPIMIAPRWNSNEMLSHTMKQTTDTSVPMGKN